jgi:hypothetical protein
MRTTETATVIGYDADSGKQLFVYPNCVTHDFRGANALPHKGQTFESHGKTYRIVGVRKSSTFTKWEVDVREELSK